MHDRLLMPVPTSPSTTLPSDWAHSNILGDEILDYRRRIIRYPQIGDRISLNNSDRPHFRNSEHLQKNELLKCMILLRLLTGWLVGMTFSEVSKVVGMDQSDLRAVLHGKASLEQKYYDRIERMANVTRQMRSLISHHKVGWWYRVSIPRFNGDSPLDLLEDNRITDLEHLVNSYFDPSYT